MTDKIHSLTVVLEKDYRDDDIQKITNAIMMIRGVLIVKTSDHIANTESYMAEYRAKCKLESKILDLLKLEENESLK